MAHSYLLLFAAGDMGHPCHRLFLARTWVGGHQVDRKQTEMEEQGLILDCR